MLNRLSGFAPLTGFVFSILAVVAFGTAQGAPATTASGTTVIAFYTKHGSAAETSDYLWAFAFAFFLLFAGSLRGYLRRAATAEALSATVLAGAAVATAGACVYFGFDFALASVPSHLAPAAAQALNVLALKLFLPLGAGCFVFGIASGIAILRGAELPRWLGWVAMAIGIVSLTPAGLAGVVALIFWTAIVSVLVWRRSRVDVQEPLPDDTAIATAG